MDFKIPNDCRIGEQVALAQGQAQYGWPQKMLNFQQAHEAGITGKGVKYGQIDTGWSDHPDFPTLPENQKFRASVFISTVDGNGHGTLVRGLVSSHPDGKGIIGGAYDSDAYISKGLGDDGSGGFSSILECELWLQSQGCQVHNYSLGAPHKADDPALNAAIKRGKANGTIYVGASGNESSDNVGYPARLPEFIAVGAVDRNRITASFSNQGVTIDIAAPGKGILSTDNQGGYRPVDGTSFASPLVAALICLIIQWLRDQGLEHAGQPVIDVLFGNAKDAEMPGFDNKTGFGIACMPTIKEEKGDDEIEEGIEDIVVDCESWFSRFVKAILQFIKDINEGEDNRL